MTKQRQGLRLTDRAKENHKLGHDGTSQRQALDIRQPIKALRQGRH